MFGDAGVVAVLVERFLVEVGGDGAVVLGLGDPLVGEDCGACKIFGEDEGFVGVDRAQEGDAGFWVLDAEFVEIVFVEVFG